MYVKGPIPSTKSAVYVKGASKRAAVYVKGADPALPVAPFPCAVPALPAAGSTPQP